MGGKKQYWTLQIVQEVVSFLQLSKSAEVLILTEGHKSGPVFVAEIS